MSSRDFYVDLAAAVVLVIFGLIVAPGLAALLLGALVVFVSLLLRGTIGRFVVSRLRTRRRRRRRDGAERRSPTT